ncbi:MAG TPA: hypothetical protein VK590_07530 [Saprospiraceae bacterium]|nr:hypothetical protein [Saprospiraceae bacterium]
MRINKTLGNLERVWTQLDNSCGELENALFSLTSMNNLDSNIWKSIERNSIVFDEIVSLKNQVEEMIEEKKKQKESKDEWHFEHADLDCVNCETSIKSYPLNFYIGTYKGKDAQKYKCTNCDYEEIKTLDEMHEKEYSNKLE